jgi:hypothetical protein
MINMIERGACEAGFPRKVYVGLDSREKCLALVDRDICACGTE